MTCENNKECDYLNITYLDNTKTNHTIYLDVKKSTIKGINTLSSEDNLTIHV